MLSLNRGEKNGKREGAWIRNQATKRQESNLVKMETDQAQCKNAR